MRKIKEKIKILYQIHYFKYDYFIVIYIYILIQFEIVKLKDMIEEWQHIFPWNTQYIVDNVDYCKI